jgi:putative membrane protein
MIQDGGLPKPITYLTADEAASLDALVVRLEAATGTQIVPAIVGRADSYPEIPWKAFGLGASLAGFGLVVADYLQPQWATATTAIVHVVALLGVAAACALVAGFSPPLARLLLNHRRADGEVRQFAQSLFLQRAIFATRGRTGLLVLVSLFERRVEIVADTGFNGRVADSDWHNVIARMTPHLRRGRPFDALRDALGAVETLLTSKGFSGAGSGADELPNAAIQERGE